LGEKSLRRPIVASIVIHAVLMMIGFGLTWKQAANRERTGTQKEEPVWLTVVSEPVPEPKLAPKNEDQRVVQTAPSKDQSLPDDPSARVFRGERNQRVERETVSRQRQVQIGKVGAPSRAHPTSPSILNSEPKSQSQETEHMQVQAPTLSQLGLKFQKPVGLTPKERLREAPPDTRRWAVTASAAPGLPQDYVQGLDESETTALNTREYVFYGYFQRIRERLDRAWYSRLRAQVEKVYKKGRRLASDYSYTTRTLVTLNPRGHVIRVKVLESSGAMDLDDAGIQAFNEAGPFPNPPSGLLDPFTKEVQISWDFVVNN